MTFQFIFLETQDPFDHDIEIYDSEKAVERGFSLPKPEDGEYISGLYLEGARWDFEKNLIAEQQPKILYSKVPIIHLLPRVQKVTNDL